MRALRHEVGRGELALSTCCDQVQCIAGAALVRMSRITNEVTKLRELFDVPVLVSIRSRLRAYTHRQAARTGLEGSAFY